jgi:membrane protease subunit HflK
MFYETMEEILPDMKVIIEKSDGTTQTMLPLESFTGAWSAEDADKSRGDGTEESNTESRR